MKLTWSTHSLDGIKKIVSYIATDNPIDALEVGEQIFSSVEAMLPDNPHAGRPGRVENTRELIVHAS